MLNKKGIAMEQLVVIIIVIVSFLIIAGTVSQFISKAEDKEVENLCRTSINLRAQTALRVGDTEFKTAPSLCKTIEKKISGDRVELKEQIAEKMARCWWMFNEGSYDQILDTNALREVVGVSKSENDCFICYTLPVDQDEIAGEAIPPEEMMRYLAQTNYPKIKGTTYLNYIQSYENGGPGRVAILDQVSPRQAYGIAFLAKNKKEGSFGVVEWIAGTIVAGGAITCAILEPCGAIIGAGTLIGTGVVGGGIVGVGVAKTIQETKARFYENNDRTTSAIVFDNLGDLQANECKDARDISGE